MASKEHKLVVAIKHGFYGGAEKRVGEEFTVESGEKASWFKPVTSKVNGPTVLAQLGEPSSPKPESAVQTFNLTGDEDHDKDERELMQGDKLTGFELGSPGDPGTAQDPKTLSQIAKQPVVDPVKATGVKGMETVEPRQPAPSDEMKAAAAAAKSTPAKK